MWKLDGFHREEVFMDRVDAKQSPRNNNLITALDIRDAA